MLKYKLTYQFLLVSLCAIIGLQAQEKGFVEISGFLLHNEKRINECFIKYSTHSSTDSVRDIKDGKFKFRLELNREYLIEFGAHKFESKFIAFSTIVEKEKELDRWSKLLIVNLEKEEEFSTWNSEKKPVAKYKYHEQYDVFYDYTLNYSELANELKVEFEKRKKERKEQIKSLEEEIKNSPPNTQKSIKEIIRQKEAELKAYEVIVQAKEILFLSNEEAEGILKHARMKSLDIINRALRDSQFVRPDNEKLTKIPSREEIEAYLINYSTFINRKDITEKRNLLLQLEKLKMRSSKDSLLILEVTLYVKQELLKTIQYQIEIDRLQAKTKEDSLLIIKREEMLRLKETEIEYIKREIQFAKNRISIQQYEIKNKNTILVALIGGSVMLLSILFILVHSYRRNQRVNALLEKQNQELEKLSIVASETDNAILIMDSQGNFEWLNEGFTRLFGYDYNYLINNISKNIIGAKTDENIRNIIKQCINNKQTVYYELNMPTKDGKRIWIQTTLTPILDKDKDIRKLVAIDTDISLLKDAQREILEQKEEIEQQRNELQKANATKDKFFSIIAHDLRSPLATFVTVTKVITERFEKYTPEQLKKMIIDLHHSSAKTYNLLENLLEWSRSQRGKIPFNPKYVDLHELAQEVADLFRANAKEKGIELTNKIQPETYAFIDENMIRTVIRNLTSNALKFTQAYGVINIEALELDEQFQVIISDTGVGIESEAIDKLFRIDVHYSTLGTENEKGTGLGLILCKEFVERNNGKIAVESVIEEGSKFKFTIPKFEAE